MVTSSSTRHDEKEPIVAFSKQNNRVSWFSDTDHETDLDEDVLVNGGPIHHYNTVTRRKRPYTVRYKEYCTNKRTKKRAVLLVVVLVFLIVIVGLVYLYYSKTSLEEEKTNTNANPIVQTDCGKVQGVLQRANSGSAYVFMGIPYAEPPIGSRRWKAPVDLSSSNRCWEGTYDATRFRPQCAQVDFTTKVQSGSEDCLYLNIFTPVNTKRRKLPVLVWIHGGGFLVSNGTIEGSYPDAEFVTRMNVVAVTMNYRLNVFGFLALDALSAVAKSRSSGNYGILDQIMVLKWIKKNIANFGGEPESVTIMGYSSGGTSVFALLVSPLAKGLFNKGISISGSAMFSKTHKEASEDNKGILKNIGCDLEHLNDTLACLYNRTTRELLQSISTSTNVWNVSKLYNLPLKGAFGRPLIVIDPVVVPFMPSAITQHKEICNDRISVFVGSTGQEVGVSPPVCLKNVTWNDYSRFVHNRLDSFSTEVSKDAIMLYYNASRNKTDLQAMYDTMVSDVRVTCPNNVLSRSLAASNCHTVFRYIVTYGPSHTVDPLDSCSLLGAYHGWDVSALFGFKGLGEFFSPAKSDIAFMEQLQQQFKHFIQYGHPLSSRWNTFPSATGIFTENDIVVDNKVYHQDQCKFWMKNGFLSYGWVN